MSSEYINAAFASALNRICVILSVIVFGLILPPTIAIKYYERAILIQRNEWLTTKLWFQVGRLHEVNKQIVAVKPDFTNDWFWNLTNTTLKPVLEDAPTNPPSQYVWTNTEVRQVVVNLSGKEVFSINHDWTVYTFRDVNRTIRYIDESSNVFMARWEKVADPVYSFFTSPYGACGFNEGPSNIIHVIWRGSNIFRFPGTLKDANMYGPTNGFRIHESSPSSGSYGIQ